ncbi:MAG: enoyl-CoA hydratase/isomerase family protein [Acidimicrobiia bacterium]
MSGYQDLIVERRGSVGWLIFNRPESYNAMGVNFMHELPQAWAELDADDDVRVIVNSAMGDGFCTGVDLKELAADPKSMVRHSKRLRENNMDLTSYHCEVWKPVICAVNGVCAGGGLHFVADADIVIASSNATFLDPHVSVGQVAAFETIGLLPRMPFAAVSRMMLMGRHERLDAERALQLGLISQIVDPPEALWDEAQRLAELVAENSPSAMMVSKRALWDSLDLPLSDALTRGAIVVTDFWRHPDCLEGPAAYSEKRPPRWAPPTRDL